MKNKIIWSVIGVFMLMVVCIYAFNALDKPEEEIVPQNPVLEETQEQGNSAPLSSSVISGQYTDLITDENNQKDQKAYCYIKEFNGYLAIYNSLSDPVPNLITDINLSVLPTVDAELIKKGFGVSTKEELSKLLEDLGS